MFISHIHDTTQPLRGKIIAAVYTEATSKHTAGYSFTNFIAGFQNTLFLLKTHNKLYTKIWKQIKISFSADVADRFNISPTHT